MKKKTGKSVDMYERIGNKYNYLTIIDIIKRPYKKNGKKYYMSDFKCQCECGNIKIITAGNVMSGATKSCGCKKSELCVSGAKRYYKKTYPMPVEHKLFGYYKNSSRRISREFKLTEEEFIIMVNSNCYYCGCKPFTIRGNRNKSQTKNLNGIDRIDSSIGYTTENCVPCCITCNKAKNDMGINDFKLWIKRVNEYRFWEK